MRLIFSMSRWQYYLAFFKIAVVFLLSELFFTPVAAQQITRDFLIGKTNYSTDTAFIKVSPAFSHQTIYLKNEAYLAFQKMHKAALKQGIRLFIISGARSFKDQKFIWEHKWKLRGFASAKARTARSILILQWSSMPGTSRHHWGTDIDLNNMRLEFYQTAEGKKMYNWLCKNAPGYGFQQPFNKGRLSGYREEKWHWSYIPLSKKYLTVYLSTISYQDIDGFEGAGTARELNIIKDWVLTVNESCKTESPSYLSFGLKK